MTFRYIGSKARVAVAIRDRVAPLLSQNCRFVDGFTGTGAVAEAVATLGAPLVLNDTLNCAVTMAHARLVSQEQAPFVSLGGYRTALAELNSLSPIEGFMTRTYSPASKPHHGLERRYFTQANAERIDAIRGRVREWSKAGELTDEEEVLLLGDLVSASNRVANIAGTYGCFLSTWQKNALDQLEVRERPLRSIPTTVIKSVADVHDLATTASDIVYYDPPYTKRQYASYYHILETIVLGDAPSVEGVCGLRPWRTKASVFCYKRKALAALAELIASTVASSVVLSYSCEGHVDLGELRDRLLPFGDVEIEAVEQVGRYRPNEMASRNGDDVTEYLLVHTPRHRRTRADASARQTGLVPA